MQPDNPLPILLIEDSPENRQLACWMLEDAGYDVEEAETAEQGLALLSEKQFCLVLMDISLPGMDGKEATKIIRQNETYGNIPVVALTAHASEDEKQSILNSGANAVATKPIDEDKLIALVSSHTKR